MSQIVECVMWIYGHERFSIVSAKAFATEL
jgi:hypothetical protein